MEQSRLMKAKAFFIKYKRFIWGVLLLGGCIYYIVRNHSQIVTSPTYIDYVIIAISTILVLYPLFSEMSILGVSVKKDIESMKTESKQAYIDLKGQIIDVKSNITQIASVSSSSATNIYLGENPSQKEMNKTEEALATEAVSSNDIQEETLESKFAPNDNAQYLFRTRYTLERYLLQFYSRMFDISSDDSYIRMDRMISALRNEGIIDGVISNALKQVYTICNRGIHGKIISNDHMNFVKKNIKLIYRYIEKTTQRLGYKPFYVCEYCGFAGSDEGDNICPKCENRVQAFSSLGIDV